MIHRKRGEKGQRGQKRETETPLRVFMELIRRLSAEYILPFFDSGIQTDPTLDIFCIFREKHISEFD